MIQSILFILLISVGVGLPLTLLIAPKHNVVGRLGLSYLLGIGFFTLVMFITNILGLRFSLPHIILTFIFLSLPLVLVSRNKLKIYFKEFNKSIWNIHFDKLEKVTLVGILFLIISNLINTLYWPVYIWDSLTLYDFRARLFANIGTIKGSIDLLGNNWNGYYLGYPLLTSLSHTVVYSLGGNNPQFIYSLFYLSLGLIFYGQLREFVSRKLGLLFTLMLLTIPQIFNMSVVAYTNLPYMAYLSLGIIYFFIWDKEQTHKDKKKSNEYLILSALLVGLSTWVRSTEPFWLAILGLVILFALLKRKYKNIMIFSTIVPAILCIWKLFLKNFTFQAGETYQLTGYTSVLPKMINLSLFLNVLMFLYKNVFKPWGPLPILLIYLTLYSIYANVFKKTYLLYIFIFMLLFILVLGTFIFSMTFKTWNEIPDSVSRMSMVFYPLFVFLLGLNYSINE